MRAKVLSSHALAADVGSEVLSQGGSALRAVLSGFFAAAGQSAGILLGPMTLVIGGVGSGARAFDGRCRQPGLEGKRPRGFQSEDEVEEAALAAIPGSVWAAGVATAYHPGATLTACARPGIVAAKKCGSPERAALLEIVAAHGTRCFLQPALRQAWLTQFGPVFGGAIQPRDLEPRSDLDAAMREDAGVLSPPWGREPVSDERLGAEHGMLAVDAQGLFVGMIFRDLPDRNRLEGFDVTVPLLGKPVFRGVTRLAPGSPLETGARLRFWKPDARTEAIRLQAGDQILALFRDHQTREVTAEVPGILA